MTVKPRQSVKLTDPQTAFLNAEARSLGITVAELIRRIIDEYRSPSHGLMHLYPAATSPLDGWKP